MRLGSLRAPPARARPGPFRPDRPGVAQLFEHEPDRPDADTRERPLDVAPAEPLRGLAQDVVANLLLLAAGRLTGSRDAPLEIVVGVGEDARQV
jgi:hypothetical protein